MSDNANYRTQTERPKLSDSPAAVRQRRRRARKRQGIVCVTLEVSGDDLDVLSEAGLVDWDETRSDPIAKATRAALDDWKRRNEAQ